MTSNVNSCKDCKKFNLESIRYHSGFCQKFDTSTYSYFDCKTTKRSFKIEKKLNKQVKIFRDYSKLYSILIRAKIYHHTIAELF